MAISNRFYDEVNVELEFLKKIRTFCFGMAVGATVFSAIFLNAESKGKKELFKDAKVVSIPNEEANKDTLTYIAIPKSSPAFSRATLYLNELNQKSAQRILEKKDIFYHNK